jgi:prevent-host-death family protein
MSMNTYTTEAARAHLGTIISDAAAESPSLITYHGMPAAVVVSWEWYQYVRPTLLKAVIQSSDGAKGRDSHTG